MINNIKNEFFEILDEVPWMDAETRLDAKTKVRFIIIIYYFILIRDQFNGISNFSNQ
jgi:hypothetical protein